MAQVISFSGKIFKKNVPYTKISTVSFKKVEEDEIAYPSIEFLASSMTKGNIKLTFEQVEEKLLDIYNNYQDINKVRDRVQSEKMKMARDFNMNNVNNIESNLETYYKACEKISKIENDKMKEKVKNLIKIGDELEGQKLRNTIYNDLY